MMISGPTFLVWAASGDRLVDSFPAIGTGAASLVLLAFLIRELVRLIGRSERHGRDMEDRHKKALRDMELRHRQELADMRDAVIDVIDHVDDATKARVFRLMWGPREGRR